VQYGQQSLLPKQKRVVEHDALTAIFIATFDLQLVSASRPATHVVLGLLQWPIVHVNSA